MANVAHKNLTGVDLHEVKGADTATVGQVPISSGSGTAPFGKLTHTSLQTTGNPFGAQLFHVREQQANGVSSTTVGTSGWTRREINTSVTNEITSASIGSSQVTLPAGTYFIQAWSGFRGQNTSVKLRWRNITDGSTTIVGLNNELTAGGSFGGGNIGLNGRFTIAGSKVFELQYNVTTSASLSTGAAQSLNEIEVYADILIWKIA